jgi:hypothetical protein
MAKGHDVLQMLIPTGGWVIAGDDYETIQFLECDPITKEQFEAGFAVADAWRADQEAAKVAEKSALLAKLGITADEARLLLL